MFLYIILLFHDFSTVSSFRSSSSIILNGFLSMFFPVSCVQTRHEPLPSELPEPAWGAQHPKKVPCWMKCLMFFSHLISGRVEKTYLKNHPNVSAAFTNLSRNSLVPECIYIYICIYMYIYTQYKQKKKKVFPEKQDIQ